MPDAMPACFRAAAAPGGGGRASSGSGAGASLATSVYDTRLGLATLSWSRAALGLSLRAVLRVTSAAAASSSDYGEAGDEAYDDEDDESASAVDVRVRPWLLWRRRGTRRFRVGFRRVDLAWDLSRARFPPSGSPEPSSGYFVAVVVDGEMAVVAGDMAEEAYGRTKARRPPGPGPGPVLVSRREHVTMVRDRGHRTCVVVRGREREIAVDLVSRQGQQGGQGKERERDSRAAEVGMSVSVDGDRVLHVRRLRWKFRGTEKVDLGGGDRVLVSWDLHNWLFPARDATPPDAAAAAALAAAATPPAHAVFVFRFELAGGEERDPADSREEEEVKEPVDGKATAGRGWAGYVGRWGRGGGDWSESSSNNGEKRRQARRLAKASSSSSASVASSSASWASGSTVMDWGSPEDAELQRGHGFSLLVYAWKN